MLEKLLFNAMMKVSLTMMNSFCCIKQIFQKTPEFPYEEYERFDLQEMDDAECKAEFRFAKMDIPLLAEALGIPEKFICHQGTRSEGIEGLCMLLKRLTYPCRYSDLIPRFGRPVPVLSMISNTVLDFIYNEQGHKITQWNNSLLNPANLEVYAAAISDKGAALDNCIGFIDGTARRFVVQENYKESFTMATNAYTR